MRMAVAVAGGLVLSLTSCVLLSLLVFGRKSTLEFLRFVVGLGRWRYRCSICKGTGICRSVAGQSMHHSGCGDCRRVEVPSAPLSEFFRPRPADSSTTILGCGYHTGSLWDVLRHGRWRPTMHHCPDAATEFSRWES